MADYIKREEVYDQLDRWARDLNNPQVYQRDDARCVIDGIPSADVAPVRHGKWIKDDVFGIPVYRCSACDKEFWLSADDTPQGSSYRYCPNCGARMDGDENDD